MVFIWFKFILPGFFAFFHGGCDVDLWNMKENAVELKIKINKSQTFLKNTNMP